MPVTRAARIACVTVALFAPWTARADESTREKEACVAASEQAQTLRDEGKYRAARAQLSTCASASCPAIVRRDCEKWLGDLDTSQPTVVLGARDPKGNDVTGARVLLDGAPLLEHLDGRPVAVDPGDHTFRYEAPNAAPVEQHAVVRVGEKNRMLTVTLAPSTAQSGAIAPSAASGAGSASHASSPSPAAADADVAPAGSDSSSSGVPAGTWVLGAVGVAALASFTYFGVTGRSDVSNLRDTCAPNCAQSDVDSAHTKLVVADVSLAVGAVSLGVATWIFFAHQGSAPGTAQTGIVQAGVAPVPGGAMGAIGARF